MYHNQAILKSSDPYTSDIHTCMQKITTHLVEISDKNV